MECARSPADVDEPMGTSIVHHGPGAQGGLNRVLHSEKRAGHSCHHPTLRVRRPDPHSELVKQADETLFPTLSALPGFSGYYLIDAVTAS